MPEYLTPGAYFEWVDESAKAISPLRTDVAAFVGVAERGPLHWPARVISWQQFQSLFGTFIPNGFLAYAVKAFFENGGRECQVVRVAAPLRKTKTQAGADPAVSAVDAPEGFVPGAVATARQKRTTQTAGVQPGDRASSLVVDVKGLPQGALVKMRQNPAGPFFFQHVKATVDSATEQRILWKAPLDPAINLAQTIHFETVHLVDLLVQSVQGNAIAWETPLPDFFDLGAAIDLETGVEERSAQSPEPSGTASGELLGDDRTPTLAVAARDPGGWGNDLRVAVSRGHSAATRTARVSQPADRKSSLVEGIAGFVAGCVVRIYQPQLPQPIVNYRAVAGVDAARNRILWHQPLDLTYDLVGAENGIRPISFETVEFALSVYCQGELRETFSALSLFPEPAQTQPGERRSPRKAHAETIVNGASSLIRIRDLRWKPQRNDLLESLPHPGAANLRQGRLALMGGRDGIAALRPRDFTGDASSPTRRGMRTLEMVDSVSMVAVPDAVMPPVPPSLKRPRPAPPAPDPCLPSESPPPEAEPPAPRWVERSHAFTLDQIEIIQRELVEHCERHRDRIALLDPPMFSARGENVEIEGVQGWRRRFDSQYAALYFPWLLVRDPLNLNGNIVRAVPPSGHMTGICARTDVESGVHVAPANVETRWAQAPAIEITPEAQGVLNPAGINCFRAFPGRGLRPYGARTISSHGLWRFVNVRRLMIMVEEALEKSLQWSVFEPHDLELRHALITGISSFLELMWAQGALNGRTAEEAFFVRCDETNNPDDDINLGRLRVDVGVAPVRPAEFVVVRIGKTADGIEITEAPEVMGAAVTV